MHDIRCLHIRRSFNPTSDLAALEGWFRVLAQVGLQSSCLHAVRGVLEVLMKVLGWHFSNA